MPVSEEKIVDELMAGLTVDYKPRRTDSVNADGQWEWNFYRDIDRMLVHPVVDNCLRIHDAGLSLAEVEVIAASSTEVGAWAVQEWQKFWELMLYKVQRGDRYGWIGGELVYEIANGKLALQDISLPHPFDALPLELKDGRQRDFAGVRVKRLADHPEGSADLRPAGRWPGKAFWYGHECQDDRYYGHSQLRSSHRPWQRLAERNGIEEITDLAVVRTAVPGPKGRYPEEALNSRDPNNNTLVQSTARQGMRKLMDDCLAGMGILLSSKTDDKGNYLYDFEWPTQVLNAEPLLSVDKHLESRIAYGIGTPMELVQAQEGGGWSGAGRNVTMETFLSTQQRIARQKTLAWYKHYAQATAKFNFGPDASFTLRVKPLIQSRNEMNAGLGQEGEAYIGDNPQPRSATSLPPRQSAQANNPRQAPPRPAVPGRERLQLSTEPDVTYRPSRVIRTRPPLVPQE